jgi:pyruvate dehydrogenase E2 component (dihydrolipoamide acetyltransferase)
MRARGDIIMKKAVKMPVLSDTMETGHLVRWLKQEGDEVRPGDSLAEVETDKAVMELEAFDSGYLAGPLAVEDQDYPVGEKLASITDESPPAGKTESEKQLPEKAARKEPGPAEAEEKHQEKAQKAAQASISWPEGEEAAAAASAVLQQAFAHHPGAMSHAQASIPTADIDAGPDYELEALKGLRKVIAGSMAATVQTPQFRVSYRIDLAPLREYAEQHGLSFTAMLAKACALTIRDHPDFNAAWTPRGLARRDQVDVAIAMDTDLGLNTPVLRDVAHRSMTELAEAWRKLKDKVDNHRAVPEDFRGASFYLSNLGMFEGVVQFDAIVPLGAAAVLSVAAPEEGGSLLTLNCDHRVVSGADAARFLQSLGKRLTGPSRWAEDES